MRLFVTRWEARDESGYPVGWLEHAEAGWMAGVHGAGFITGTTTLVKATEALRVDLASRGLRLAS